MKPTQTLLAKTLTLLVLSASGLYAHASATPMSATVLEFADPNTLFVADSDGGKILAYQLPNAKAADTSASYNLEGAGTKIAALLGVASHTLSYHDIAIHPTSKEAYISVSIETEGQRKPVIIRANQAGEFRTLELSALPNTSKQLTNTPSDAVTFWRDIPATTLGITDLDYVNGTLYVSSLSTGEFSSTLRKVAYPFDETSTTTSIEIYHTVHDQTETRAPIRAMTVLNLNGEETVVAAYTCTPLVTIPTQALTDGAHIKGKTIAELGYGNTPLDVIDFAVYDPQTQKTEYVVLVIHKERSADLIRVEDLVAANQKPSLSTPEMWAKAGVPTQPIPLGGVLQVADQDEQYIATLKRNLSTGDIDLVSFRKGAYFRLNDFISEYNFPDYKYYPEQEMFRNFQNLLKTDSGYSDLVREMEKN